jgi:lipopolysaccharide/colanic/teichoic acid biosynthesis glycosyltransferase
MSILTLPSRPDAALLQSTLREKTMYLTIRRFCEILAVLLVGLPASLVIGLAAIAILITMGGPVFFIQERVGLGGKAFRILKLRTMVQRPANHIGATLQSDGRITPLGRLLRASHVDELPQLWNILRGDMSMVGPRPEQPHLVSYYQELIPNYRLRHMVPPGLTGYAQVYFGYAANLADTRTKLEYDLHYVQDIGAFLDLRIIFKTIELLFKTSSYRCNHTLHPRADLYESATERRAPEPPQ